MLNHLVNSHINMVDLYIYVGNLIPKGIHVSANFFSHFPHNVDGFLVSVVHDSQPEVLVQLVQSVISGDFNLGSLDIQETVDLD